MKGGVKRRLSNLNFLAKCESIFSNTASRSKIFRMVLTLRVGHSQHNSMA